MTTRSQAVMDALRRVVQAARQSSAHCERVSGLTAAQLLILKSIQANPGLSINDLAAVTLTHQASVSEVVGRLENRGLLIRARSQEDARRRELQLTPGGLDAVKQPVETVQETLIKAMDRLPPDVLENLANGLERLIHEAGLSHEQPSMLFEDGKEP